MSLKNVATVGMFDGVHLGHRLIIDQLTSKAAESGGNSVVFTFENHPLSIIRPDIAPKLLSPGDEKRSILADSGISRLEIVPFDDEMRSLTAEAFLTMLRDRYATGTMIMGFNNRFGRDQNLSFDDYRSIGRRLGIDVLQAPEYRIDETTTVSSSAIRSLLLKGDVRNATAMLGYNYPIAGTVAEGHQIGRKIGFPTANIVTTDNRKLIPTNGVYACRAALDDGRTFPAMVNIGSRPTVNGDLSKITIEAHLLYFDGNLYGSQLHLAFLDRLRDEKRFGSFDGLRQQIEEDRKRLLEII